MFWVLGILVTSTMIISVSPHQISEGPTFIVTDTGGYAFLFPDGTEWERIDANGLHGDADISPDGRWISYSESLERGSRYHRSVIRSIEHPEHRTTIAPFWEETILSRSQFWSRDSRRVLICERRTMPDKTKELAYRIFDTDSGHLSQTKALPSEFVVSGWTDDGRRLLVNAKQDNSARIAWINSDGTGEPEFVTSVDEVAFDARLSPDGGRILCVVGPKVKPGERSPTRLCVINLSTSERAIVDTPGEIRGYCWSGDGSQIAYTWQKSLEKPGVVPTRTTMLITCNSDGSDRKTVTSRTYEVPANSSGRNSIVYFFVVRDWR